jgi:hypothetical protein
MLEMGCQKRGEKDGRLATTAEAVFETTLRIVPLISHFVNTPSDGQ